jgi:hypothetical protein
MPYKTPEAQRERNIRYHKEHRTEIIIKQHEYYQLHKDELNANNREYQRVHREEIAKRSHQYRQEHLTQEAEHHRTYYVTHKKEIAEQHRQYKEEHKEMYRLLSAEYRRTHREEVLASQKRCKDRLKNEVMTHYGNGKAACVRCGYDNIGALDIDHINGDGAEHRKREDVKTRSFYAWLKQNNFPEGFQTLCSNCNQIKAIENKEHKNAHTKNKENK